MQSFDVRYERLYSAHHTFLRSAREALKQAELRVVDKAPHGHAMRIDTWATSTHERQAVPCEPSA